MTEVRPTRLLDEDVSTYKVYKKKTTIMAKQVNEPFEVDTLEGTMKGKAGDWLAIGAKGEFYPIDAAIFAATYEEVK